MACATWSFSRIASLAPNARPVAGAQSRPRGAASFADLHYRLNVFPVEGALRRERRDDIALLVQLK